MTEALAASGIVFLIGAVVLYCAARYMYTSTVRNVECIKRATDEGITQYRTQCREALEQYRTKCEETLGQYRRVR